MAALGLATAFSICGRVEAVPDPPDPSANLGSEGQLEVGLATPVPIAPESASDEQRLANAVPRRKTVEIRQDYLDPACTRSPDGLRVVRVTVWADTGDVVSVERYCFGFRADAEITEYGPGSAPAAAPPPPSAQQVADAIALPAPEVTLNPEAIGVVGLETWLWWDAATTASVGVNLDGWTGTVTARVIGMRWDMGNGEAATAERTGTEANPSTTYTYPEVCACTVTFAATWEGTFTLTHPLAPEPYIAELGTQTYSASRDYTVSAFEAVITD